MNVIEMPLTVSVAILSLCIFSKLAEDNITARACGNRARPSRKARLEFAQFFLLFQSVLQLRLGLLADGNVTDGADQPPSGYVDTEFSIEDCTIFTPGTGLNSCASVSAAIF